MKTSTRILGILALALATASAGTAAAAPTKPAAGKPTTGYAKVNDLEMYYEIPDLLTYPSAELSGSQAAMA